MQIIFLIIYFIIILRIDRDYYKRRKKHILYIIIHIYTYYVIVTINVYHCKNEIKNALV